MKICFLINDLNVKAGWGRMAFDLINAAKERGIDAQVISREEGLLKRPFFNFFKIRKIISDCGIIQAFDVWPFGFLALVYSMGLDKKIIISTIGTYSIAPLYNFFLKILSLWSYKRADKITAISYYTANEIKKIIPDLNIDVLPNGVDFDKWSKKTDVFPEIFELKPYILGVGGVKQRKGFHNSIRAFAEVAHKFPDLKYVIVGQLNNTNYVSELKDIIIKNHLDNRVIFLGKISDEKLVALYQNAEFFILTPEERNHHFEGFGLVYLEAAACGLPSIGSRKSGAETAIKEGVSGVLVNQGNVHETVSVIEKILSDENFKNKLSIGAIEWARQNTWQKASSRYFQIYEEVLTPTPKGVGAPTVSAGEKINRVIVTTSWDDGDVLDVKLASLLDKYGVKGTFYITLNRQNRLSNNEIAAISNKHEIGAHTMSHPLLTEIPAEEAEKQIAESKNYLEKIIGKQIKIFAYPAGDYNASIIDIIKSCGFKGARTTKDWSWDLPENAFEMPTSLHVYPYPLRFGTSSVRARLKPLFHNLPKIIRYRLRPAAIFSWRNLAMAMFDRAYSEDGTFHIWGHSWEIDKYQMWDDLENLLKYISSKEGIEFKTNGEII